MNYLHEYHLIFIARGIKCPNPTSLSLNASLGYATVTEATGGYLILFNSSASGNT